MEIKKGYRLISMAGRDKGKVFYAYDFPRENYISLVDGKLRKIELPKIKKIKHVKIYSHELTRVGEKIQRGEKVTNSEIRKSLSDINSKDDVQSGN